MGRRLKSVAPMLFAVLVVSGVALVLSACGGGGGSARQEVNARRQSLSGKLLTVYRTLFTEVPGKGDFSEAPLQDPA